MVFQSKLLGNLKPDKCYDVSFDSDSIGKIVENKIPLGGNNSTQKFLSLSDYLIQKK